MIGALVFATILFYGVTYSGMSTFSHDDIGILDALRGKISATPKQETRASEPARHLGRPGTSPMTERRPRP